MGKKIHPLAWVGIGCAVLLLVGLVAGVGGCFILGSKVKDLAEDFEANPARAAAEMVVRINPDLEKVSVDDSAGAMTIRDKKSGEEYTVDFEDIAEGRFEVRDSAGNVTFGTTSDESGDGITIQTGEGKVHFGGDEGVDDLPDWLPVYPGSEVSGTYATASVAAAVGGESTTSGAFSYTTSDSVQEVAAYFRKELGDTFKISDSSINAGGTELVNLTAKSEDGKRSANITITQQDGATAGIVQYSDQN